MSKQRVRKMLARPAARKPWRTDAGAPPAAGGAGAEGGSGGDGGGNQGGGQTSGSGGGNSSEKTLPQSQVDQIVATEKRKAKEAAEATLAEQLGVPLAKAKEIIEAANAKADADKTEAQKARDAADKEKLEAEQAKAESAREIFQTRADRALIRAGVKLPDKDEDAVLARVRGLLAVKPGATAEEITTDVAAVKSQFPDMFGASDGKPPPDTDPKGRGGGGGPGSGASTGIQAGLDRAKKLYENKRELPAPAGVRKTS